MAIYVNPYYRQDFIGFFVVLLKRLWGFATGALSYGDLAPDEIQILVLTGIAISAALVGTFLVLRRMAMLANSLSHTILLGIVIAYLITHPHIFSGDGGGSNGHSSYDPINIQAMLFGALVMGIMTTFLTEFLTKTVRLQEDASTGLVFTSLFALGVILITLFTRNAHIGSEIVMGNVDALHIDDIKLVMMILVMNVVLFTVLFKEYQITTFDGGLASALGFSTTFFNYLLMTQVSATAIGAFRAVGVLMVLAFITGPPLTARLLTHSLKRMIGGAVCIGVVASVAGVALSRHILTVHQIALSTAGLVVSLLVGGFLVVLIAKLLGRWLWQRQLRGHATAEEN